MSATDAVVVSGVTKTFSRYHPDRPWTIQETLARGLRRIQPLEAFTALNNVSVRIPKGRTVGIIGSNGSGKSTLLRLIGGIGKPDAGTIETHGRLGALLDLTAGFHPDLTGRENAMMSGILSGLTRAEVLERWESIVAFSEVGEFLDHPTRTYSTGMQMRLAFATAVHTDPEILLIDEVLSVGDIAFQRKCLDRIAQYKKRGCSILLVSHEASVVQDLCDDVIWLNRGTLMAQGPAHEVIRHYVGFMARGGPAPSAKPQPPVAQMTEGPAPAPLRNEHGGELVLDEQRFGSSELAITGVRLLASNGEPLREFTAGEGLGIVIVFNAATRIVAPVFRVRILRPDGVVCCDLDTEVSPVSLAAVEGEGTVTLWIDRLDVAGGRYIVDIGCYAADGSYAYDFQPSMCTLGVGDSSMKAALLRVPHHWDLKTADHEIAGDAIVSPASGSRS